MPKRNNNYDFSNILYIEKCKINWCLVRKENFKGWMNKKFIWGVKKKEIIEINFLQRFEDLYWKSINSLNTIQKQISLWFSGRL